MRSETANCAACGAAMEPVKPWLSQCRGCGFQGSTLVAGAGTGIDGLEHLRHANFELLLDQLAPLGGVRGKRLLEVGSARGWFLAAAARRGADVQGIEPEMANAQIARDLGLATEVGLFPDDLGNRGPYDIIVFNDVLEHIPDPARTMSQVEALLAPGGLAVVNLPSSAGTLYALTRLLDGLGMRGPFERMWQMGFPSPHISYFNPANLRAMVENRTSLVQVATHALPSVSRQGLWPRIRSSHSGLTGAVMFAGIWPLSFALGRLPADIHVAVFRKPAPSTR